MSTPIIFCSDVFDSSVPHPMWNEEARVAFSLGQIYLLDHDELLRGNTKKALRKIPQGTGSIIYHGWMMIPEVYYNFYTELTNKGYTLINSLEQYLNCHHFENWYSLLKEMTPASVIVKSNDIKEIIKALPQFGKSSLIIKDFVSSQKHAWNQACFILNASNIPEAEKVITRFINLQNEVDGIQGGIILRKFEPLKSIGKHPKSGMPLSQEFRIFVLNGKIISNSRYWEYGEYSNNQPPNELLLKIISKISSKSNLFTIDVAQTIDNDWICIEVGDGQVSSLPENGNKKEFYSALMC